MGWTGTEIPAMEDSLDFWVRALAYYLFEKEEGTARAMVGWNHGYRDALGTGDFKSGVKVQCFHIFGINSELLFDEVSGDCAAILCFVRTC